MARANRRFVHFVVTNLTVPRRWRVGRTTLYPAGDLLRQLDTHLDDRSHALPVALVDDYRHDLGDVAWATIAVPVLVPEGRVTNDVVDVARGIARDTIGVLRLYQRVRVRYVSLEHQTFGLDVDIGSVLEARWVTDSVGHWAGGGWSRHGVLAPWEFRNKDLRTYRADPRFRFVDEALRDSGADDWRGRLITAIRTMSLATVMQQPSTRIVLLATALEALLGDPFKADQKGGGGHRLAKRAAYLSCGRGLKPESLHRLGDRPACELLTTKRDPVHDPTLYHVPSRTWACSWYGAMRNLYADRNAALHGAVTDFTQQGAANHRFQLDDLVLATVEWVLEAAPASISDLDAAIDALPAA